MTASPVVLHVSGHRITIESAFKFEVGKTYRVNGDTYKIAKVTTAPGEFPQVFLESL